MLHKVASQPGGLGAIFNTVFVGDIQNHQAYFTKWMCSWILELKYQMQCYWVKWRDEANELGVFLERYGKVSRAFPVDLPESEYYQMWIVEFESGLALTLLNEKLLFTFTTGMGKRCLIRSVSQVYTTEIGRTKTKTYYSRSSKHGQTIWKRLCGSFARNDGPNQWIHCWLACKSRTCWKLQQMKIHSKWPTLHLHSLILLQLQDLKKDRPPLIWVPVTWMHLGSKICCGTHSEKWRCCHVHTFIPQTLCVFRKSATPTTWGRLRHLVLWSWPDYEGPIHFWYPAILPNPRQFTAPCCGHCKACEPWSAPWHLHQPVGLSLWYCARWGRAVCWIYGHFPERRWKSIHLPAALASGFEFGSEEGRSSRVWCE